MDGKKVASGFSLKPLSDGNVIFEFCSDDGEILAKQIITNEVVRSMPSIAGTALIAIEQGVDAVVEVVKSSSTYMITEESTTDSEGEIRDSLLEIICEHLDEDVVNVASDAIEDLLQFAPEGARKLLSPIVSISDFWCEQMARAACNLPSGHTDDLVGVLRECLAQQVHATNSTQDVKADTQENSAPILDKSSI